MTSWDDWVPQDRLRKLTDDNKELAANLRRELTAQLTRPAKPTPNAKSRKQGSEFGSLRGSEERHSSVPAGARGTKRGRDNDIEKVSDPITSPWLSRDTRASGSGPGSKTLLRPLEDYQTVLDFRPKKQQLHTTSVIPSTSSELPHNIASLPIRRQEIPHDHWDSGSSAGTSVVVTSVTAKMARKRKNQAIFPNLRKSVDSQNEEPKSRSPSPDSLPPSIPGRKLSRATRADVTNATSSSKYIIKVPNTPADFESSDTTTQRVLKKREVQKETVTKIRPRSPLRRATATRSVPREACLPSKTRLRSPSRRVPTAKGATQDPFADAPRSRNRRQHIPVHGDNLRDLCVNDVLIRLPPADEAEYISNATWRLEPQHMFAPLIGGTTQEEKNKIDEELIEMGIKKREERYHPGYIKTKENDPGNLSRLAFYEGVDTKRKLAIAGVPPTDPIVIDPPGSGTPFDALKYPNRLVQQLNRNDAETLWGWDAKALNKIPKDLMLQVKPHALVQMPNEVLVRQHQDVIDKLPSSAPFFGKLPFNSKLKRPEHRAANIRAQLEDNAKEHKDMKDASAIPDGEEEEQTQLLSGNPDILHYRTATRDKAGKFQPMAVRLSQEATASTQAIPTDPYSSRTPTTVSFPDGPIHSAMPTNETPSRKARVIYTGPAYGKPSLDPKIRMAESLKIPYSHISQEDSFTTRPSIRITIPDHLKNLLVDDWENVTKSLLLVPLPSQAPANFIIDSYFNEEKMNRRLGSAEADVLEEFCSGLKVYFEKSVGKILLYRFERSQLAEVSSDNNDKKGIPSNGKNRLTDLFSLALFRFESCGNQVDLPSGKAKDLVIATAPNTSPECSSTCQSSSHRPIWMPSPSRA